ncbi:MAG: hypothetical protein L0Y42_11250, partial [Phycisphaerales bacterium]|nr:hypothetical protein [Phycisphaerales bacterium]
HGYAFQAPGAAYWQSQSKYNDAGSAIFAMGALMGTSPTGGTGGSGFVDGATAWLNPAIFNVSSYYASGFYCPTIVNMTQSALGGNIVAFAYGRYEYLGDIGPGAPQVGARTGGHVVTLSKAVRSGDNLVIAVRDPADDPDASMNANWWYDQSPFGNRVFNSAKQVTALSLNPVWVRPMTALKYPLSSGDDKIALIDKYVSVGLKYGLTFTQSGALYQIKIIKPSFFLGAVGDPSKTYEVAAQGGIPDLVLHPDHAGVVFIRNGEVGDPTIEFLDGLTGEVRQLLGAVGDPSKLQFGRKRELYALAPDKLICLDLDAPQEQRVLGSVLPPSPCKAMTFDDKADEIVLVSDDVRNIYRYRAGLPLITPSSTVELPQDMEVLGELSMAISPIDKKIWLAGSKSTKLHGFLVNDEGQLITEVIELPGGQIPTSIEFDDAGHLFVTSNGQALEFERSALSGQWMMVENPYFAGFEIGKLLRVSRSRTNFDPAVHVGPGFVNIDPEELTDDPVVLDCEGDFNFDRVVNVDDLLALITAWGPCDVCVTDTNDDRIIDVDDLLGVISNWGQCP